MALHGTRESKPVQPRSGPSHRGGTAKGVHAKRFVLDRTEDETGTSGTGIVAEGIQFSNGQVVIHWLSQLEAINVYANTTVLEGIHGHDGRTTVRWLDK